MRKNDEKQTLKTIYICIGLLIPIYIFLFISPVNKPSLAVLAFYGIYMVIMILYTNIALEFTRSKSLAKIFLVVDYIAFVRYSLSLFHFILFCLWFGIFIYLTQQDEKINVYKFIGVYILSKILFILLLIFI